MTTNCHFCGTPAQAIKREAVLVEQDEADAEVITKLPVCYACAEAYFDGTEAYPGTLPLPEEH
jgi:hypothetical protein